MKPDPLCTGFSLEAKVAALRDPRTYPGHVSRVDAVETHMSWVFLTPEHAYKLKKPVSLPDQDFSTLRARHHFCEEELRLNRRLAADVYLAVLPLQASPAGMLRIGQEGPVVDWLVQMRRLPAESMLDFQLAARQAAAGDLRRVGQRLCRFYRQQPPAPLDGRALGRLMLGQVDAAEIDLCRPQGQLAPATVKVVCDTQRAFLRVSAQLLDRRVGQGRVVEVHGDLRPEHVYLGEPLAIIDCLEFSARLRMQDAADEVGFLALECERAGAPDLGRVLLDTYRRGSGDDVDERLVDFYQGFRATVRARLAIRRLAEPGADEAKWRLRARQYLALCLRHLRAARLRPPAGPSVTPPHASG